MILYFLPMILFLGIITSYEDFKFGKIRNKWIILALTYTIIVNLLLFTFYGLSGELNTQYYIELITNLLFTILVGFGFWYFNIWSAGDGKLFIAFANLIPLSAYSLTYYKWIPSLTLLLNIFQISVILMIFLIIKNFKKSKIKLKELFKEIFDMKKLGVSILSLFTIFWIIKLALDFIGIKSTVLTFLITFLVMPYLKKILGKQANIVMLLIMVLRLIFDKSIYSIEFLKNFIIITFFWRLIRMFFKGGLSKIAVKIFSKNLMINKLKKGMILAEKIEKKKLTIKEVKELEKNKDVELVGKNMLYYIKKPKQLFEYNNYLDEESEGVTTKQIKQLKKIGFKQVRISKTIHFASIMFIGVLFTILVKGNLLILIKNLF